MRSVPLVPLAVLVVGLTAVLPDIARSQRGSPSPPCANTLIKAVVEGNSSCVERILAAQPLQPATGEGYDPASPLVLASALGHTRIVELLLPSHAAHVNRAAVVAAGGRPNVSSPATVALLFKQILGDDGGVPARNLALGIALLRCHDDVVQTLKAAGVLSMPNAFQVALNNPMHHADEQLYELGVGDPWLAAARGDMKRLEQSLSESSGPNVTTACGETPLMSASASNQLAVVKYLLGRAADPNLRNRSGKTALMAGAKHPEIVRTLKEAGAKD